MSEENVRKRVLYVLRRRKALPVTDLWEELKKEKISFYDGRRALLGLVDDSKVRIEPDWTLSLIG